MRLSEITTERAAEVLCELVPLIDGIVSDEDLMEAMSAAVGKNDLQEMTFGQKMMLVAGRLGKIVPILMKKRRTEMFGILAVLNEKTSEEIAQQNMIETMRQIHHLTSDKDLMDFFKSCRNSGEGA